MYLYTKPFVLDYFSMHYLSILNYYMFASHIIYLFTVSSSVFTHLYIITFGFQPSIYVRLILFIYVLSTHAVLRKYLLDLQLSFISLYVSTVIILSLTYVLFTHSLSVQLFLLLLNRSLLLGYHVCVYLSVMPLLKGYLFIADNI